MSQLKKPYVIAAFVLIFLVIIWFQSGQYVYQALTKDDQQVLHVEQVKGQRVEGFTLPNKYGELVSLSHFKGKKVIINFWASWCGPCKEEFPSLVRFVESHKGEVILVAISLDKSLAEVTQFLDNYSFNGEYIQILMDYDQAVAKRFGTIKLPESYLLDRDFVIQRKVEGSIDWSVPYMSEFIKSLK